MEHTVEDLWIVLLDTSESMSDPFKGTGDFAGQTDSTNHLRKIEAAKDRVLKELHGMKGATCSVVTFADNPSVLFTRQPPALESLVTAFEDLRPSGGTNIGAALSKAVDVVSSARPAGYASVLLITDGLSTVGDPLVGAERCRAARIPISTVLIDPTPEAERLAHAVSMGGRVTAVTSAAELGDELRSVAQSARVNAGLAQANPWLPVLIGTLSGLLGGVGGSFAFFSSVVDKPTTAVPLGGASIAFVGGVILWYVAFAKRDAIVGTYSSINQKEPRFPKVPRYRGGVRLFSAVVAGVLHMACLALVAGALSRRMAEQRSVALLAAAGVPGSAPSGASAAPLTSASAHGP